MRLVVTLLALGVFVSALAFASIMGLYAYYARELPDPSALARRQLFQTARILDRHGRQLQELNDPAGGRRTLAKLADVGTVMRDATIAAEDASFYDNPGFDARAVVRATYQFVRSGAPQSGASTITQQLVKNTLLGPEQTAERKIKEAFLAMELTRRYSKDQILEMYLNEIFYGNHAYGVLAAADTYFGKSARDLTLAEASMLAGLPQAPAYYDPYTNLAAVRERQQYVLDQMARTGVVTQAQAEAAFRTPLELKPISATPTQAAPHFATYVRQIVEEQYGTEALFREGLQVTTSLDLDLQHIAEEAARQHIDAIRARNATNAAVVAIRPNTGEILAMLGSVDFDDPAIDGQVNVALAPRQPGSTLKPFTYLTAFARGWSPATVLWDVPTTFGGDYRPNNFDNRFLGPMRIRDALAQSRNIPAVQALEFVSVPEMIKTAHRMGIQDLRDAQRYGLSVTLGGGEVRLRDLTYAYAVLANAGRQVGLEVPAERRQPDFRQFDPVAVLKVTTAAGKVLYEYRPSPGTEIVAPGLAYQVTSILADDAARAPTYGRNSPLVLPGRESAVKTGTTDEFRDSWVVGYTPELVTGVWVGNTDNTPMRDVLGVAGAGQIWHSFMEAALDGTPPSTFERPRTVVEAEVCALSTLLPTPECRDNEFPVRGTVRDVFVQGVNLPTQPDTWHQRIEVCRITGNLATPLVPANAREEKIFVLLPEPFRTWGSTHGFTPPPTADCADIYAGERIAQIAGPKPGDRIEAGATVQIVGTAYIDDFHHYSLEIGAGENPASWTTVTDRREQAVDNALLGVWNTAGQAPGRYTLRLRVYDRFDNAQEGTAALTVSAPPTPTPAPTVPPTPAPKPTAAATSSPAPTRPAAPTATVAATPVRTATPRPAVAPTASPRPR